MAADAARYTVKLILLFFNVGNKNIMRNCNRCKSGTGAMLQQKKNQTI